MATQSARVGFALPDPGEDADITVINNNMALVDRGLGATPCTLTTLPSQPFDGQIAYQKDVDRLYVWDADETTWQLVGSMTAVLGAAFSVTSQVVAQSVPGLALPMTASTTYTLDAVLSYSGDPAGDAAFGLTLPTGATMLLTRSALAVSATATAGIIETAAITAGALGLGAAGAGVPVSAKISGLVTTASTAGDCQATWAQLVSSTTASVLSPNSWLRLTRA